MELQARPGNTTLLKFLHSSKSCSMFQLMCLENTGRNAAAAEEHHSKSSPGITCFEDFSLADSTWKAKAFLKPELCLLSRPQTSVMII